MGNKGLQKLHGAFNRIQQKKDWRLIVSKTKGEDAPPDWGQSVKKIDKYMADVCMKHGLNHLEIFGNGQ